MEVRIRYQPSAEKAEENNFASTVARRMLRTASLAAVIAIGSTVANPEGSKISAALLEESGRQNRISMEATNISESILQNIAPSDSLMSVDNRYMRKILNEAEWASKQLNVKEAFIVSQWFYETGGIQGFSQFMVKRNNLGGLTDSKIDEQMRFKDLHDFARSYVKTLKKAGLKGTDDFWQIINKLHKANYFGAEKISYGNGIIAVLGVLRNADQKYDDYYNSIDN